MFKSADRRRKGARAWPLTTGQTMIGAVGVTGALALAVLAPRQAADTSPKVHGAPSFYGVNLPTATFGKKHQAGKYGKDYAYPTRAEAQPFSDMGMNTVRLGFTWERIQREPMGPLDASELRHLDAAIDALSGFQTIILDLHNYGSVSGTKLDDPSRGAMLADLWTKLARHYGSNPKIAFGIMNEPHDIDAFVWRKISDQALAAIRAAGARNLVLVPGTRWTGGHSWNAGGEGSNAAAMSGLSDSNFMFEIHQYLDSDSSGTNPDCADATVGSRRLAKVTKWLRAQRAKAVLAEFGAPPTSVCMQALDDLLTYLDRNSDVWAGWTYWAGGSRWKNYPMSIQPENGQPRPQSEILARHIAGYRRSASR
ncbi:MAG: glycoside hydrolase family 5 protein [Sphingomonas sp.]